MEFVEALTVILAVGAVRGWRPAILGALAAVALLAGLVAGSGAALPRVPTGPARIALGVLLLLFGLRWLRKATRRAGGRLPLRDERRAFERHRARLAPVAAGRASHDPAAFAAAFQATAVEGIEVVFLVVAVGGGGPGLLEPAILGAGWACAIVVLLGLLLHRPIARIPGNTLKRVVGAILSGFGTFWLGEGAGLGWPAGEASVPVLVACFLAVSAASAMRMRRAAGR